MKGFKLIISLLIYLVFLGSFSQADRLKDLASLAGVRSNQLVGYGVVVGLAGTGDGNTGKLPFNLCNPWFPDLELPRKSKG